MADQSAPIAVQPNDVFRTKAVTTGWNAYQTQADITAGKVAYAFPGNAQVGRFVRDVQTAKGWYSLMELTMPVTVSTGVLSKVTLTHLWIQNVGLEKATLTMYTITKGSTNVNRRIGPGTEYAKINPPLQGGQTAGKSDGTVINGFVPLYTEEGRLQWVSKTYLTSAGQLEQSTVDSLANNLQTSTSWLDVPLLLKSIAFGVLVVGLGYGLGYLVDHFPKKRRAL
ncbi:hypothetical protein [Siphonobacter sp.]|uniref:hypothetical protein n=1 Tax=Siphonobacter sp. TaxID=1869184 RepID=UPI003B3A24F7